jgi:hypothetical protein
MAERRRGVPRRHAGTSAILPGLGAIAVATAPFLLLQAFGLGRVIATFGLVLDLVGFLLLLVFVVATSVAGYRLTTSR